MAERRRRRRRGRISALLAALALLAAPVAVAVAAYIAFAVHSSPDAAGFRPSRPAAPHAPEEPREPAPLIEGEPVPSIPLGGVDAFHIDLRKPPRAGLVFDLDTGEVLWRRRPLRVVSIASLTKIMTALVTVDRS